ncbi:phosphoribosylglycinamide formyltransferase [Gemella sp. GH3]|uniref:phosphoribosylglycinamide formyltransferase n=1 Tax=unclassified Gemella TaxID=2624949 RepID=UPI0015D06290|nr:MULTISPECIES: phosphoribosylglycinamide formyltransferase [unclassified Gemella]MBF0713770.1 phosphoribosylglycinamide formyltransferase [Gemella sp. GH3.1]NYS50722.1 phosphoribosylglycinamide formyltransferase [Gemella sp. GH3]
MKKRVAIFASGEGSNFEKIADNKDLKDKIKIEILVCDNKDAPVIQKAEIRNIPTYVFSSKDFDSKEDYEREILKKVHNLDYIFLAGYMRIISPYFLENYKNTIINIHPSLLPKYKGKNAIEKAYNANEKEIGVSIHYVNEEVDGGDIIAQKSIEVSQSDTLEYVTEKIHKIEHELYPYVILKLIKEEL